ncbi:hypothetical protein WR25_17262 [Diploscapter pachys]|uniref:Uncharacterized protein n=1 Tax=Diploscapter pachys TaxID=2018661 RepID=A0A2A2K0X1_9BILA|nr:hypothetical protein WR25_17262 [Diploscapter pachys]
MADRMAVWIAIRASAICLLVRGAGEAAGRIGHVPSQRPEAPRRKSRPGGKGSKAAGRQEWATIVTAMVEIDLREARKVSRGGKQPRVTGDPAEDEGIFVMHFAPHQPMTK